MLYGLVGSTGLAHDTALLALITKTGTIAFSLTGFAHVNNFFVYGFILEQLNGWINEWRAY